MADITVYSVLPEAVNWYTGYYQGWNNNVRGVYGISSDSQGRQYFVVYRFNIGGSKLKKVDINYGITSSGTLRVEVYSNDPTQGTVSPIGSKSTSAGIVLTSSLLTSISYNYLYVKIYRPSTTSCSINLDYSTIIYDDPQLSVTANPSSITYSYGGVISLSFGLRLGNTLQITLTGNSRTLYTNSSVSADTLDISYDATWFNNFGESSLPIQISVSDSNSRSGSTSVTLSLPSLSLSASPYSVQVGNSTTISINNRANQSCSYIVKSGNTVLDSGSAPYDSFSVYTTVYWYYQLGASGTSTSISVTVQVSDSHGRTASTSLSVTRPSLSISPANNTVYGGNNVTLNFNSTLQPSTASITFSYSNNTTITTFSATITSGSTSKECLSSWIRSGDSETIKVNVTDNYYRTASTSFTLKTLAIVIALSANQISSGSGTSSQLTISLSNLLDISATTTIKYGSGASAVTLYTDTRTWSGSTGSLTVQCADNWFSSSKANVINSNEMNLTVAIVDANSRTSSTTFKLLAGDGMKPTISSASITSIQPNATAQTTFGNNYYITGYSKIQAKAAASGLYNATISRVQFAFSSVTTQMSYDSTSQKYIGTTTNPIMSTGNVVITVTDSRGLSSTDTIAISTLIPYSAPNISIDSYRRCRSDGTADDSGSYCQAVVSYTFTALNNLNGKDTVLSVTGYNAPSPVSRTLSTYTATETYLFAADIEHSYTITITATDTITSTQISVKLSTAGVIMDFLTGGKGIGLGKVAEYQNMVEVNPEWEFKGSVKVNGTLMDLGTVIASILNRL